MNTQLMVNWPNIFTAVFILIILGMLIFIASFVVAELQTKKFKIEYEILKDFINKAPINKENYQAIYDMFNDTYCYTDDEKLLIQNLWRDFEAKFHEILPDSINNQRITTYDLQEIDRANDDKETLEREGKY